MYAPLGGSMWNTREWSQELNGGHGQSRSGGFAGAVVMTQIWETRDELNQLTLKKPLYSLSHKRLKLGHDSGTPALVLVGCNECRVSQHTIHTVIEKNKNKSYSWEKLR